MLIVFLIVSTLISAAATTLIAFGGLGSTEQRTSTQGRAAEISKTSQTPEPSLAPISKPTNPPLPTATPTPIPSLTPTPVPTKIIISPYLTATSSADKKSVFVSFNNLLNTKSALYKVNYSSDGGQKAAQGNVTFGSTDQKVTREVILGICSGSNCTYDTNVKNMKIETTFTLTDNTTSQITYPYTL